MTFTTIPPSLRPVVEDVARAIWAIEWPAYQWPELHKPSQERDRIIEEAEAAISAFLNACVERGVGHPMNAWQDGTGTWKALGPQKTYDGETSPALILNLGATDDTA